MWCPKTQDAFRILSDPKFGTPTYIIIHTGTNDLRSEQERVGGLVCRVAERATEAFPNSKIILSTLLPRKDFHPATIQRVNADITRGCALLPNVHLAHHSTILPHDLYDHVHLNKHALTEPLLTTAFPAAVGNALTSDPTAAWSYLTMVMHRSGSQYFDVLAPNTGNEGYYCEQTAGAKARQRNRRVAAGGTAVREGGARRPTVLLLGDGGTAAAVVRHLAAACHCARLLSQRGALQPRPDG
ncbi:hypothetical protein SKAU_G00045440 [Synaphobranchus kaupii]|uniref:Uncharacterized protein n=1 Tax=Synaphobranchus kaupii TaxID=118154 RepID=A0A9Q1J720_SYNKA|nr:hypothetical protein SKAU_G00045440 [Synaphobranchus kaupii]